MTEPSLRVVVAGVPRSLQNPQEDGRWLKPEHIERIVAVSPRVELIHTSRTALDESTGPIPGAEILLIEAGDNPWYHDEISRVGFAKLVTPTLRWIQTCSSGVGHVLDTGLVAPGVVLTNAAGVHAAALAESVMGAVLFNAKRLEERLSNQRSKVWRELYCRELRGLTLCVLGTGHIGREVAIRARSFGMHLVGVRRTPRDTPPFDKVVGPQALDVVLPCTDYLVIACPLTSQTEGLIDAQALAALKEGAFFINVSRGKVVDEVSLLQAVSAGRLSGAFLDAHAEEPLPRHSPIWATPGITVIPRDSHSSPYIGDNIVALFADNLCRHIDGEPLRNVVDQKRGY